VQLLQHAELDGHLVLGPAVRHLRALGRRVVQELHECLGLGVGEQPARARDSDGLVPVPVDACVRLGEYAVPDRVSGVGRVSDEGRQSDLDGRLCEGVCPRPEETRPRRRRSAGLPGLEGRPRSLQSVALDGELPDGGDLAVGLAARLGARRDQVDDNLCPGQKWMKSIQMGFATRCLEAHTGYWLKESRSD
jgi:hypothetical protein